jgi:hypothetical protein
MNELPSQHGLYGTPGPLASDENRRKVELRWILHSMPFVAILFFMMWTRVAKTGITVRYRIVVPMRYSTTG